MIPVLAKILNSNSCLTHVLAVARMQGSGSGRWWKLLKFCGSGSTKKEAVIGSKLGWFLVFEESEAEAFFIKHGAFASSNLATIFGIKYSKKDS